MKEPVITHPAEAFGKNMLQYELQKILAGKSAVAGPAGLAFRILEGDPAVFVGDNVFFADYAPV